jgi:hypothetical protein
MAGQHRERLQSVLSQQQWQWVKRDNPAQKFPTDFGLIRAPGASLDIVQVREKIVEVVFS